MPRHLHHEEPSAWSGAVSRRAGGSSQSARQIYPQRQQPVWIGHLDFDYETESAQLQVMDRNLGPLKRLAGAHHWTLQFSPQRNW
ncbi:hypothetical protein ElyMa_002461500 [Elysia marginata]|uniref:Uncharacterized protein n=1 Tax=Elysia marginata TaxID=1093978 RepID=A0AAV4GKH5_9GAST|nr:hypothetical protein ElyMa_002461500 [Elysia marginata]